MFKKILYPTDFSDVSARVMDYIRELKGSGIQTVILLHVIDQRDFKCFEQGVQWVGKLPAEFENEYRKYITDESNRQMGAIAKELTRIGLEVRSKLVIGVPFVEILKAEEEESVSAIILGSHGKSNIREMMLGSVSEKVIRKSKTPVIVIKR
ncbi:MAG TPA: universal stress protein [Deltaproteobacteria bacterium]|nr:universal stress protein [Deltaproteobacteria bacterium]HOD72141.1 universal stress protein [Deltaproteobacteria bacterium]HPA76474.1 universal stress protein [Deltaproteobacteria bacterium]